MKNVGVLLMSSFSPSAMRIGHPLLRLRLGDAGRNGIRIAAGILHVTLQHLVDVLLVHFGLVIVDRGDELPRRVVVRPAQAVHVLRASQRPLVNLRPAGKFWNTSRALGSSCISLVMFGCAALHAGHSRSPNSTMVMAASFGPCEGPLTPFSCSRVVGKRIGAERHQVAGEGMLLVGGHIDARHLLTLAAC